MTEHTAMARKDCISSASSRRDRQDIAISTPKDLPGNTSEQEISYEPATARAHDDEIGTDPISDPAYRFCRGSLEQSDEFLIRTYWQALEEILELLLGTLPLAFHIPCLALFRRSAKVQHSLQVRFKNVQHRGDDRIAEPKLRHGTHGVRTAIGQIDSDKHMAIWSRGDAVRHQDRSSRRANCALGCCADKDVPQNLPSMRTDHKEIWFELVDRSYDTRERVTQNNFRLTINAIKLEKRFAQLFDELTCRRLFNFQEALGLIVVDHMNQHDCGAKALRQHHRAAKCPIRSLGKVCRNKQLLHASSSQDQFKHPVCT